VTLISTTISDNAGFEALRRDWQDLAGRGQSSIFMTWEWQYLWWKHYGKGQQLCIFVVRDEARVVAILPLYVQRARVLGVVSVRILRNVGTGGDTAPDDLDPLVDTHYEEGAAEMLAQSLVRTRREWDLLRLADLNARSGWGQAILRVASSQGWRARTSSAEISYIDLPKTWDEYLASTSSDRRALIRRQRRLILALPQARMFAWDGALNIEAGIQRLIELHHMRWQALDESHAFSSEDYCNFHGEIMRTCAAAGSLRLYCLEVNDSIIAMLYCYRHGNGIYYFQGGFDPAYSKQSAGAVLMGFAIESAIGEGAGIFDMLRGQYEHKRRWAKQSRQTSTIEAHRWTAASLCYALRRELLPAIKRRLLGYFGSFKARTPGGSTA
jgi:CelD/BcsL family acetyltransferase involved in cellulose biosynthesis